MLILSEGGVNFPCVSEHESIEHTGGSGYHQRRRLLLLPLLSLSILIGLTNSSAESPESIISRFQQYLPIDTAQPNPDYKSSTDFLLSQAESIDLESQTFEFVPGKPIVLLKWPGSNPSLPPILLNSHTDVVPSEYSKWNYHPFSAELDEHGNIYARGSQEKDATVCLPSPICICIIGFPFFF